MEVNSRSIEEKKSMAMKMREEAMRPIEDDFDNYMKKVDLVESVLKRLASGNSRVSDLAMKEADILLKGKEGNFNDDDVHIKKNRTVINQQAFDKFDEKQDEGQATMHPNEFMKQVEEDCKQRAEDRRLRKKESDRHKNEGNRAFREQKYAKALVCYDKAIEILKDSCILYCNRSLTYLKLGLAEKALKDAEMSLKANDKSLRGFIYKAQALWHLGKDKESQEVIEEACRVLPDQDEYLKGILLKITNNGGGRGEYSSSFKCWPFGALGPPAHPVPYLCDHSSHQNSTEVLPIDKFL